MSIESPITMTDIYRHFADQGPDGHYLNCEERLVFGEESKCPFLEELWRRAEMEDKQA